MSETGGQLFKEIKPASQTKLCIHLFSFVSVKSLCQITFIGRIMLFDTPNYMTTQSSGTKRNVGKKRQIRDIKQ